MKNSTHSRTAPLLVVLALAVAACTNASADDTPTTVPDTTPVIEAPVDDTPVQDEPMPVPGEDIVYRPIDIEPDLPADGHVPGGGELIAVDGKLVTIGFWMGVEDCYGVQRVDVTETETKVAIDITVSARDADQVCIALAEARSITVELDAELGDRILEIGGVTYQG
ncbi:MAG: hypothetical protein ACLGHX_05145 [Acidimicrobiia bacterium]